MEILFAILSLSLSAPASMPREYGSSTYGSAEVYYASWCDRSAVIFNTNSPYSNTPQIFAVCSEMGMVCVQEERQMSPNYVVVSASCKYRR